MRLLLDTHALAWWALDDKRLSPLARMEIGRKESDIFVSIASTWEMAIKVGLGKWPEVRQLLDEIEGKITAEGFQVLSISIQHVRMAGLMQSPHRDPFDRLLAAQAIIEGLTLVSADSKIANLGAPHFW